MARQNSRYFTPVIKKLLEAKQKEAIVVDEAFKTRLRAQLMTRAFVNLKGEEKQSMDFSGLSEFFRRWKYQLALVPTVLVLALVAVQAFKMPVSIPGSGTIVPTVDGGKVETEQVTEVTTEPKIKTFAGKDVLPSDYFEKRNVQPMAINFEMGKEVAGDIGGSGQNSASTGLAAASVATTEPVADGGSQSEVIIASIPVGTQTQVMTTQPATTQASRVKENTISTQSVPVQEAAVVNESANDNLLKPELVQEAPSTYMAPLQTNVNAQPSAASTIAVSTTAALQKTVTPSVKDLVVTTPKKIHTVKESLSKESVIINYNYSLSDADKKDLEDNVIAQLIKDKENILMVNVDKAALEAVKIEILYDDTKSEEFLFRKNVTKGVWEKVKYATKYYYDDSLEYVKLDLLLPSYYNYGTPLLYPYDNY